MPKHLVPELLSTRQNLQTPGYNEDDTRMQKKTFIRVWPEKSEPNWPAAQSALLTNTSEIAE